MPTKASLAWRIGLAIAGPLLCLWWAVNTTGDLWLFGLGFTSAAIPLCWGRFWSFIMFLRDALMAMFGPSHTPEYDRTVDGVREAALRINNWLSRHTAAALSMACMIGIYFTHSLSLLLLGLVAVPAATSWPWLMKKFREWRDSLYNEVID